MRTYRFAIPGLIGVQFAFLVSGFIDAWLSKDSPEASIPSHAFAFIIAHTVALGLLVVLMERSRRNEARRFAELRVQMERSARHAEDLIQCSSDLVWEIDATGTFTFVSDHMNVMRGIGAVAPGHSIQELAADDPITSSEAWQIQADSNRRGEPFRDFRYASRRDDGSIAHFTVNGVPVHDTNGRLIGFRGLTRDCTREVEALEQTNRLLSTDVLTGLANRRAMRQWLSEAGVAVPNQPAPDLGEAQPFAYLLLDLDGFKAVNDLYGHAAGDEVLIAVANRLRGKLGDTGFCARIGGDEFAVILPGADEIEADAFARGIVAAMTEPVGLSSGEFARFGASVGISLCPQHGTQAQMLFRSADQALYEVKHRGGGTVQVASDRNLDEILVPVQPNAKPSTPRAVLREREDATLVRDLRGAMAKNEFHLVFQPIVSAVRSEIAAYEALLRWNSPDHGNVSPAQFIPLAESSGLILPIGAYVLREACRLAAEAGGEWAVTVNVSALQFAQPDLVAQVLNTLAATGLPPSRLILELTEQSLVSDHTEMRARMRALRAAGVRLALDDFGAGFANVSYLRDFAFDVVKIDRAILLLPDHQRAQVLGALLDITRSFETPTVVEGIETVEDWTMAQGLGCALVQGYLLGRPAPNFADVTMGRDWPQTVRVARQIRSAGRTN